MSLVIGPAKIVRFWQTVIHERGHSAEEEQAALDNPTQTSIEKTVPHHSVQLTNHHSAANQPPVQRKATTIAEAKSVFQWTDPFGKTHFGDRPPDTASNLVRKEGLFTYSNAFQVKIVAVDYALPVDINHKVELAVEKIYEIYHRTIGVDYTADPLINLKLYNDFERFKAYRNQLAPKLESSIGFYVGKRNEAVVYDHGDFKQTLQIITHECSHAILNYERSWVPPWLDEGLAEYFETMELFGQAVIIHPNTTWEKLLPSFNVDFEDKEPLISFLDVDYDTWYSMNGTTHRSYGISWSLVFYLMSSAQGKALIGRLLQEFSGSKFQAKSSLDIINDHYKGGFNELHSNWHQWLSVSKSPHRY